MMKLAAFAITFGALVLIGVELPAVTYSQRADADRDAVSQDATALFARDCAACHGAEGKGDGAAAMAFDPPPPNFTDPAYWEDRTEEAVSEVIASGKGAMAGYADSLSEDEIEGLVAYIRTMSGGATETTSR